jgi:hypothetical protein
LLNAVDEFEAIVLESAKLGDENFDANRRRGIELRRLMGEKRSAIGGLAEKVFEDLRQYEQFRSIFNDMRAAMAAHHAAWPLVSIELTNPDYRASVRQSRDATHHLIRWVRMTLGEHRPSSGVTTGAVG